VRRLCHAARSAISPTYDARRERRGATRGPHGKRSFVSKTWQVLDLGTEAYRQTWARQLALVEQRQIGAAPDTLIVVEHPHVFTLGRRRESHQNVLAPGDVEVVEIERGGDVTYHGPGQLVCYPIVLLDDGERDLHAFLRHLEDAVIRTCARAGLTADREPGKTGVWLTQATPGRARKKLCSMGIACRKWVTFHGLALNVTTDLSYFRRINPCGFEASVMTSLQAELPGVDPASVRAALVEELGAALGRVTG
jgi:lipoyl(octanoyl) transferase